MQPFLMRVIGSGVCSAVMFPDIQQNPFQVGIGLAISSTAAASAIVAIEHTFDFSTVMAPSFNGATAKMSDGSVSTAIWFQNSATVGSGGTTVSTAGINTNYAFAVAAIRLNVNSAVAALPTQAWFIQSVKTP